LGVIQNKKNNMENKKTLSGYAIVFCSRSKIYRDKNIPCWEVVERGAITQNTLNQLDIKYLIEGNTNKLLARSVRGVGSLKLSIDSIGLRFVFDVPNTEAGIYAYELVQRGDISGMSAKFSAKYRTVKDGTFEVRYINKIDKIASVSLTSDPDFTKTSVKVESYSDSIKALREKI